MARTGIVSKILNKLNAQINPATEEGQAEIVQAIENITIPAPTGGATEEKQDDIISAIGSAIVGIKSITGDQINPATEESLQDIVAAVEAIAIPSAEGRATEAKQDTGNTSLSSIDSKLTTLNAKDFATAAKQDDIITALAPKPVSLKTIALASSGNVHTPAGGKKTRIFNLKFSLSADLTDVSFRWSAGGTDFIKFLSPKAGGYYGTNIHPEYLEGATDAVLYCVITGTGTAQINLEYTEV